MSLPELAQRIELADLRPESDEQEARALVEAAARCGCSTVVVSPALVRAAREAIDALPRDQRPRLGSVAAHPTGALPPMTCAIEATQAAKAGAQGIDIVPRLPRLLRADADGLREDLLQATRALRAVQASFSVRVVVDIAALLKRTMNDAAALESMVREAARAARSSGCDGLTLGTGWPAIAPETARLARSWTGGYSLKAAGVRTAAEAAALVEGGMDILEAPIESNLGAALSRA